MADRLHQHLPLNGITAFEAAARHGNFSRAAEELGVSQAAVSRQMKSLETAVNSPLFQRERYSVSLTDHGKSLFACVAPFISELNTTVEQIQREVSTQDELVVCTDLLVATALSPLLPDFSQAFGDSRIRLISSSGSVVESPQAFSIALQIGGDEHEGYTRKTVCHDEIVAICQTGNESMYCGADGQVDLELVTLLELDNASMSWPSWSLFCETTGTRYFSARQQVFRDVRSMLNAVEQGIGIALGWGSVLQQYVDSRQVSIIPGLRIPVKNGVSAYILRGVKRHPLTDDFIDWLSVQRSMALK
ncbi:MAG: LysR family transcriptional regulator [Pseudomonadota bacterium]